MGICCEKSEDAKIEQKKNIYPRRSHKKRGNKLHKRTNTEPDFRSKLDPHIFVVPVDVSENHHEYKKDELSSENLSTNHHAHQRHPGHHHTENHEKPHHNHHDYSSPSTGHNPFDSHFTGHHTTDFHVGGYESHDVHGGHTNDF